MLHPELSDLPTADLAVLARALEQYDPARDRALLAAILVADAGASLARESRGQGAAVQLRVAAIVGRLRYTVAREMQRRHVHNAVALLVSAAVLRPSHRRPTPRTAVAIPA